MIRSKPMQHDATSITTKLTSLFDRSGRVYFLSHRD